MATEVKETADNEGEASVGNQIYRAIPQVMKRIGSVGKNGQNKDQQYRFRGIDDVMDALSPAMAEAGVFMVPRLLKLEMSERPSSKGGTLRFACAQVEYKVYAGDGSFVTCIAPGEAFDTSDKSTNKAMAAAFKYASTQLFCVAYKELEDADASHHEAAGKATPFQPEKMKPTPAAEKAPEAKPLGSLIILSTKIATKGVNTKGVAWTLYAIQCDDDEEFTTFDRGLKEQADSLIGKPVKIGFSTRTDKGKVKKTLGSIELWEAEPTIDPPHGDEPSQAEPTAAMPTAEPEAPKAAAEKAAPLPPADTSRCDATIISIEGPRIQQTPTKAIMWFEIVTQEWGKFYTNSEKVAADLGVCKSKNVKAVFWWKDLGNRKLVVKVEDLPW